MDFSTNKNKRGDWGLATSFGFTFIELVMVMMVIGIMLAVAIPSFRGTSLTSSIYSDVEKMSSFLKTQGLTAFASKVPLTVTLNAGGDQLLVAPTGNSLKMENSFIASQAAFTFNSRGNVNVLGSIRAQTLNSGAAYDCVNIDRNRIRMGMWNNAGAGSCDEK